MYMCLLFKADHFVFYFHLSLALFPLSFFLLFLLFLFHRLSLLSFSLKRTNPLDKDSAIELSFILPFLMCCQSVIIFSL